MAPSGEAIFEVLSPGLLSTVQDAGRPGYLDLGVPRGGAMDGWSLAVANALVGNAPGAAALECTIVGPELLVLRPTVVGLAGADLGAVVRPTGRRLVPGMSHALAAGETLTMPGSPDDQTAAAGARAYLAVPGGLDVPVVLGSRSTCLAAGFGGIDGRPLRQGDRLVASGMGAPTLAGRAWLEDRDAAGLDRPIRLLPGPGLGVGPTALDALCKVTWTVGLASNRQGLRLTGDGTVMSSLLPDAGTQLSHGVVPGTIQLPPDGGAIVLLADAQPTGGYPVVGVVISADLPIMGQLAPGASVRFERVTPAEAVVAWTVRQAALAAGAGRLHGVPGWDDLGRSAGG